MSSRLRIAVTGLAASYPLGGVFWDYLQYPLGLKQLGHDVLYIEDTGQWCYDPVQQTFVDDGSQNADYLAREITALCPGLADRWFFRDARGQMYGRDWRHVVEFCKSADLFIHISASCWMREEYFAAGRVAFIDSDPMHTQASVPDYLNGTIDDEARDRLDQIRRHDVFFTFGERVGKPDCKVPNGLFDWIPTRQPMVLDWFTNARVPLNERKNKLSTVFSWVPYDRELVSDGVAYYGKAHEFAHFTGLPALSPIPIELAISGEAPVADLQSQGWRVTDARDVSTSPWVYRDYLARSIGEWSVAKHSYVASRSGWFSCRSVCYLALGVPVVVQDTGFDVAIPVGEGVLSFVTLEEAVAAIKEVYRDPQRHSQAAEEIAREYFASDRVLGRLLNQALA